MSTARRTRRVARRVALFASLSLAVASLAVIAGGGVASAAVTSIPGQSPLGTLPANGLITSLDLTQLGYQVSEFSLGGTAHSYHPVAGTSFERDGKWTVESDPAPTPSFKTRFQVLAPTDPSRFNGTVYVEWFNPGPGTDFAPSWYSMHVEVARQGAAYVGVSAQRTGVNGLVATFPDRYGPAGANLVHPGDSYSYDIFSQVGSALRTDATSIFGAAHQVQRLIAIGIQEPGNVATYVDAFAELGVYDGYLLHTSGVGRPLRQAIPGPPALPAIPVPTSPMIRNDLTVPVFQFHTEETNRAERQPDAQFLVRWEVAGTHHVDLYTQAGAMIALQDYGTSAEPAVRLFDGMLHPVAQPDPLLPPCTAGVGYNAGPGHWVEQAALRHINNWVANATPPPSAPRLSTADGTATGPFLLDAHGNVAGGVRTPHVDVPVATIRGGGNGVPPYCGSFGTTIAFSPQKLAQLYPNHGAFVSQWNQAVNTAVQNGFILPEDAEFVKEAAASSAVGQKHCC